MLNALLRLAEIDSGARRSGFVRLDAAAVAAEVVEYYEPADEQKGVVFSFETDGQTPVTGDPVLLALAVSNLIDNSLKCVAEHGAVRVRVGQRDARSRSPSPMTARGLPMPTSPRPRNASSAATPAAAHPERDSA